MNKKLLPIIVTLPLLASCGSGSSSYSYQTSDADGGITSVSSASEPENTGDFTLETSDGSYTQDGNVYTITAAGTYNAQGTLSEGQILVAAGDEDEVVIELDGATITNSSNAPIIATSGDRLEISAQNGTVNLIKDTRSTYADGEEGAITADIDLKIKGKGTLIVTANPNNGIHTNKDLTVKNVELLQVTATNNALKGKDSVTIESGTLNLIAGGDGIQTTETDITSSGNQRGIVAFTGGTTIINAIEDGVEASYNVEVSGDETYVGVQTGTYASNYTSGTELEDDGDGLKAENEVLIGGGTVYVNAYVDAIHTDYGEELDNGETGVGSITIAGGTVTLNAKDDGLHADNTVTISGGAVNIEGASEGIEANFVTISGGSSQIYGTNDGINASRKIDKTPVITVSGGVFDVAVNGIDVDGIDTNGSFVQTGGVVITRGPKNSDSAMAAVDADESLTISGGTLIAIGSIGGTVTKGEDVLYAHLEDSQATLSTGTYTANLDIDVEFSISMNYAFVINIYSSEMTVGSEYSIECGDTTIATWTQAE